MKVAVLTANPRFLSVVTRCFDGTDDVIDHYQEDSRLVRALARETYSAIVLDVCEPASLEASRPVFASRACLASAPVPLILVGHFVDRASLDQAFEVGADDFVRFPIDLPELYVRTRLALKRCQGAADDTSLTAGGYRLEKSSGAVLFDGGAVQLTPREFAIAWMLFARPGEYLSRSQIAAAVWGCASDVAGRTIEQHVYKLRRKLCLTGAHGVKLGTRYAHGYRVEVASAAESGSAGAKSAAANVHTADCARFESIGLPDLAVC